MHDEERDDKVYPSSNRDYGPILVCLIEAIELNSLTLLKGFKLMANNFEGLSAAIDAVVVGIQEVAAAIANPAVDNNDQTVIDGLTAKLTAAAAALTDATAAENAEDAGTPAPAPVTDPAA